MAKKVPAIIVAGAGVKVCHKIETFFKRVEGL